MVNGVGYQANVTTSISYKVDQSIPLYVNASDAMDVVATQEFSGWYFILAGLVIAALGYVIVWISHRYTFFAAAEGVGLAGNVLRM